MSSKRLIIKQVRRFLPFTSKTHYLKRHQNSSLKGIKKDAETAFPDAFLYLQENGGFGNQRT
jgi:hypothetical protein